MKLNKNQRRISIADQIAELQRIIAEQEYRYPVKIAAGWDQIQRPSVPRFACEWLEEAIRGRASGATVKA